MVFVVFLLYARVGMFDTGGFRCGCWMFAASSLSRNAAKGLEGYGKLHCTSLHISTWPCLTAHLNVTWLCCADSPAQRGLDICMFCWQGWDRRAAAG